MKMLLRLVILISLLQCSFEAWSQTCNATPNVISASQANIGTTTATLGGDLDNVGTGSCSVVETGIEWSTTAGGPYTKVPGTELDAGPFVVNVAGLPAGTRIFFRAYAQNNNSNASEHTATTAEANFYTRALAPTAHAASLTATAVNSDEIYLQFPAASSITNADGYIILMRDASNPTTGNLNDGQIPDGATYFLHLLNSGIATDYTVSGLLPDEEYFFAIVPYNREGNDLTYNYLTSAGFPTASATTEAEVDVNAINGGLAPTGTPLNSGSTNRALVGFALDANGPVTFESVIIHLSETTTGKFSNFRLCASTNGSFDGIGTDTPLSSGITITPSATEITITLSEALTASTIRNFFLVADVEPGVNSGTTPVQFSYAETDFTFDPNNLIGTGNQSRTYSFADVTAPILVSTLPADNAPGVDFNLNKLVLTFNENVDTIKITASTAAHRVIIYDDATDVAVLTVDRNTVIGNETTTIEVNIPAGTLDPNTDYYVLIGNAVIEDFPADNDWGGISDPTAWNFSTSGVVVNNVTSNICSGSFQSISDIVISEEASGDFMSSGTINLDFANTDFGFDISSVMVSAGPPGNTDIATIQLNPKSLTRLTLNYTLDGTNDKVDVITISGLKVYASASGSTTIINSGSVSAVWAADPTITFATINVGATVPPTPTLQSLPDDLLFCAHEDISAATIAVANDGGTFTWYNNASLSVPLATGFQVEVQDGLGIDSSVVGTVKRYVVRIDGCQSAPLEVNIQVAPLPVADAGPATASLCSGSSITLGGSPTLVGPSVAGAYQYLWSTSPPAGFTDLGSNPMVTPTAGKDTVYNFTVKIIDANLCASDILDPNATIAVAVDSTDEDIKYNSPLGTSFTLNSGAIELAAVPSINSSYAGNGVYISNGTYYFDPNLAGTAGSPHAVSYTTDLTNGCRVTKVRNFQVSNSSGSIVNLANSYCENEAADPSKVLSLGPVWANDLAAANATSSQYGYTYEFYDFQVYSNTGNPGPGVAGNVSLGQSQYMDPMAIDPYVPDATYAYVGFRVREKREDTLFGIPLGTYSYSAPFFWNIQRISFFTLPAIKVRGIESGQIICEADIDIQMEATMESGTFEISRDGVTWFSGPAVGIIDSPINSGKALFNPHDAYLSTGFSAPNNTPASGITNFYIRYTFVVPGTMGSNSSACQTGLIIPFQISNNPTVNWDALAKTEFCYEATPVSISTTPRTGITLTGYGVSDNFDGTGLFHPAKALSAKAITTNNPPYTDYSTPEDMIITATRTDGNGCKTAITRTLKVRPLFPASFTQSDLDVCYEDGAQNIVGGQSSGSYTLFHPNLTVNFAQTTINGFNLRDYFDQAVAAGADRNITQKFDLTFNTYDPVLLCSNSITKTFSINPPIPMDIGGMTSEMVVCGNGAPFELTGNHPSTGSLEISTSPTSGFISNALGLSTTGSGKATFNPSGAGVPPGDPRKNLYIRYFFTGAGCTGVAETVEKLIINPQPAIAFSSSIPAANTAYCFEQSQTPTTVELSTDPTQRSNVVFTGYGITDNGDGTASFSPTSAYQQSSLANNQNPMTDETIRNIMVTATRSDTMNCSNTANITYIVNPLPKATFAPAQTAYCYEDDAVVLSGAETNVSFQFIYRNTTTPANYSPPIQYQSSINFDPELIFNDAVSKGANDLATLQFDLIYTAISSTTGCTNRKDPINFTVAPRIPVEIAGITDNEVFCSNVTDKRLTFSPPNGSLRINGALESLSISEFIFNPDIDGPAAGTDYTFTYTVITGNNCTNTLDKTVKVLPSPRALFQVQPQCDTALIAYDAESSTNLSSATYTWVFSGETKTGQNVTHRFPGVSSYYAKLKVEHPPFTVGANSIVCSDSLQLDQIVGAYPEDIDFTIANVCEGDPTNFIVSSIVPINRVSWDFGDGEISPFGILSENVQGLPKTSGTFQEPVHQYGASADDLVVKVIGKTTDNLGGCESMKVKRFSILKKWSPAGPEPVYDMSQIDNGKGFWVMEDKDGNASWEFASPAKTSIVTNEMAWVTGATQPYKPYDVSYVNSPCFDLSTFSRPVISLKHWTNTEASDGAVLQYSIDGGETWDRLGNVASGLDWYNRITIPSNPGSQEGLSSGWSVGEQDAWAIGKHTLDVLPTPRTQVRFRVAFSSLNNMEGKDGFAFNNVVIEERNRTILVENFTELAAVDNNTRFQQFRADNAGIFNPTELVKLQYHHASAQNDTPPDVLHTANPVDQNARAAFYGVTNAVRAFVDGGYGQTAPNPTFTAGPLLDTYFSLRSLVVSPVTISIDLEAEPANTLNVKVTVKATNIVGGPGQHNIFIAIAEKDTLGQIYVLRKFLPTAAGTPLTSLTPTDPAQEITASYDMRHVSRLANGEFRPFAVIVFVQNLETKDVLQTNMWQNGTAPPEIITGVETSLHNTIRLYPNPADAELNIILPSPVKEETPLKLFDTFGKQVYSGIFKTGETMKTVPTKAFASGIYLIQVSTPLGPLLKKVVVAHE